ncbi:MAG: GerMN domain-containing protein [Oscillospiraceae bacterium]|nr:GerMN domain-containing protein [Oscillospiraceae bacterium]
MKRFLSAALLLLTLHGLCGCHFLRDSGDTVSFYYRRQPEAISHGQEDGVIAPETREISGGRDNLKYLLALYFRGPMDTSLTSPFPAGTNLADLRWEDATLVLTLNSAPEQLADMDLTIACTCLAKTCFGLSEAEQILIETSEGAPGITMTRDSFLMTDLVPETNPTE